MAHGWQRMPGDDPDLFRFLANPTNREILTTLALEPLYPRRLAELVGLTEGEASRRLRAMANLGLAEAEWEHIGKTVKLYRLTADDLSISLSPSGLRVEGMEGEGTTEFRAVVEAPPEPRCFIGREEELVAVEEALEAHPGVCVHGIGGVGKTALAARIAERSEGPLLWHQVAPSESGAVLLNRLAAQARALDQGERAERLLALSNTEEGQLLLEAIAESANALEALIVLDGSEAAEEGVGDVVVELTRHLDEAQLLVTSRVYPNAFPRDRIQSVPLEGLSQDATEDLLAELEAPADTETVEQVHSGTGGHPLSIVLLATASDEEPPSLSQIEGDVRDFLVRDVIPQLRDADREVLLSLSVLRRPFTLEVAEAISQRPHTRDALLRLEARGLVERKGSTFRIHDLIRTYATEATPERRHVHKRAAEHFAGSGRPEAVLEALHHYLEAGLTEEAGAIVLDEVLHRTHRFIDLGLGNRYRGSLDRLAGANDLPAAQGTALAVEMVHLETMAGRAEAAERWLDRGDEHVQTADEPRLRPALDLARARLGRLQGDIDETVTAYERAAEAAAEVGDRRLRAEALLEHAHCSNEFDLERGIALHEQAIEAGQDLSDPRLLSRAYAALARLRMATGSLEEAVEPAEEALQLAETAGYVRGQAAAHEALGWCLVPLGDLERAREHKDAYMETAKRLDDPWLLSCAWSHRAALKLENGQPHKALEAARNARDEAEKSESPFYKLTAAMGEALALVELGEPEAARRKLEPHLPPPFEMYGYIVEGAWSAMAEARRALGDEEGARRAEQELDAVEAKEFPKGLPLFDEEVTA